MKKPRHPGVLLRRPVTLLIFALGLTSTTAMAQTRGLPAMVAETASELSRQKAELGQRLFFDRRLSANASISCATCHRPELAFADGRALAQGMAGQAGTRNTPSLLNVRFNTSQFWDGRRITLESQATDPFLNPREHGLNGPEHLLTLVRSDPAYRAAFRRIFKLAPNQIAIQHVSEALAGFERTLVAADSPFDRYEFNGEKEVLSPSAVRGLALFRGAAKCVGCHTIDASSALFSDNRFHSLSVGLSRIANSLPALTTRLVRERAEGRNLDQTVLSNADIAELGRFAITLDPIDVGTFRTPSLRNVALTAPYMHDGSVASLDEAVELEIYYRSAEGGHPLILTPVEKADLVAFLTSLTSPSATVPGQRNPEAVSPYARGKAKNDSRTGAFRPTTAIR